MYVLNVQNANAVCSNLNPEYMSQKEADKYRNVMYTCLRNLQMSRTCAARTCHESGGDLLHWIQCDTCTFWYHMNCVGFDKKAKASSKWFCSFCTVCHGHA